MSSVGRQKSIRRAFKFDTRARDWRGFSRFSMSRFVFSRKRRPYYSAPEVPSLRPRAFRNSNRLASARCVQTASIHGAGVSRIVDTFVNDLVVGTSVARPFVYSRGTTSVFYEGPGISHGAIGFPYAAFALDARFDVLGRPTPCCPATRPGQLGDSEVLADERTVTNLHRAIGGGGGRWASPVDR